MPTADQTRARWHAGDRADITAIINGGGVDLDDTGTPLDDQWDLIAGQLDTAPADEPEPDDYPEPAPPSDDDIRQAAEDIAAATDPHAWKAGLSPVEIRLITQLRQAEGLARAGREEAAQFRAWAAESEREEGPEGDLRYAAYARQEAADADADAERKLREAIRAAVPQGQKPLVPVDQVASITGLTRSRVYQIRDGRR